jgi:hypothetical protein
MSALVLDAGALIAVDRGERPTVARIAAARRRGANLRTSPTVVAQVWRDPQGRQADLARFLKGVEVPAMTHAQGRAAGLLLAATGTADAVDGGLILLARDGDRILTSDTDDMTALADAAGVRVTIVAC